MKFGERFSEYLHGEDEHFLDKCTNVEYKRLKKVMKKCRIGYLHDETTSEFEGRLSSSQTTENEDVIGEETTKRISKSSNPFNHTCSPKTCPVCDKIFFYELTKEVSAIVGCFSSRARRLLHLHLASGFQRYLWRIEHFFADDHEAMIREGRHLVSYVAMNAIAIRKILKKYDKINVHVSVLFIENSREDEDALDEQVQRTTDNQKHEAEAPEADKEQEVKDAAADPENAKQRKQEQRAGTGEEEDTFPTTAEREAYGRLKCKWTIDDARAQGSYGFLFGLRLVSSAVCFLTQL